MQRQFSHAGFPDLDLKACRPSHAKTGRGWRLDKAAHDSQIDAAVALAIVLERAQVETPQARLLGWV